MSGKKKLESVEVLIGKRKLKLKGDAKLITASADKLNSTIDSLDESTGIKGDTLLMLAGLNLAEDNILIEKENLDNISNLNNQLDEMTSYLEDILETE